MAFTEKQQKQIDWASEVLQANEQVLDVTTGPRSSAGTR
jgi:hypothetical protein